MNKIFLFSLCWLLAVCAGAQRHALVIGINDYSQGKGVPSLKGCVNDARSIRSLLLNRFGFKPAEIETIYNEQGTKLNILNALRRLEQKVKANDVVFFYYAGHGMTFINSGAQKKSKTSEGLLTYDISSPSRSIIFDWELSACYNRIIAKGGILTVMMDCCYSGNMLDNAMTIGPYVERPEDWEELQDQGRSVAPERLWGDREQDLDSMFRELKADSGSLVFAPLMDGVDVLPVLPKITATQFVKDSAGNLVLDTSAVQPDERFIPFTNEDLKLTNWVARPHEIKNSKVLFAAAAQGSQKSRERKDAAGVVHGIFTRAVLQAYENGSVNMPVNELQKKVAATFRKQYADRFQQPNYAMDASRARVNLMGKPVEGMTDKTLVKVKSVAPGKVLLQGGHIEGIAPGFLMNGTNNAAVRIKVTSVPADTSSVATIISGSPAQVQQERQFAVASARRSFPPLIQIYWPSQMWTMAEIKNLDAQLRSSDLFKKGMQYYPWIERATEFALFENGKLSVGNQKGGFKPATPANLVLQGSRAVPGNNGPPYFIYMPVSKEVMQALKQRLANDLNVIFVNTEASANFSMYCAYNEQGKLVLTFSDELLKYKRRQQPYMKAESMFVEMSDPFNPRMAAGYADKLAENMLLFVSKFRWVE